MKSISFLILSLITVKCFSQASIDSDNATIYLKEIREVDGKYDELKKRAYEWVAKSYNNSNYVTRINDKSKIITKGSFKVSSPFTSYNHTVVVPRTIKYVLQLDFKDNKYKIEIENLDVGIYHNILMALWTKEEYRDYSREIAEDYEGPGKKAMIKRVNNDKKFESDYQNQLSYSKSIIKQIMKKLNDIDNSLFSFMKSKQEDDW
ncbi:MAG: DUF4468 domain-containing protein [Bacteroidota bacterium]